MESTTVKLYSLNYGNVRTYLAASLFIVGNILFPQFFHLIPQGGITWLPIYFFTLIGAYKYGWKVGLLMQCLRQRESIRVRSCADCCSFPYYQLLTFWYADAGGAACYFIKVRIARHCCRLGRTTFRTYLHPGIGWRSTYLSSCRDIGRVDVYRKFLQCHSGFPHWNSRNVPASIRRLFIH